MYKRSSYYVDSKLKIFTLSALVLLVFLLTLAIGISVHRACSMNLFSNLFVGQCLKPTLISKESINSQRAYIALMAEIEELENRIALKTCPKNETSINMTEDEVKLWEKKDISVLSSCWKLLGNEYRTSRVNDPTKIIIYNEWRMCFDSNGNGDQILTGINAPICRSKTKAEFVKDDTLAISDLTKVFCDDGSHIIRREAICTLNEKGVAECSVSHPEHPKGLTGSSKVFLQRERDN